MSAILAVIGLTLCAIVSFGDQPPVESKIFPTNLDSFRQIGQITVSKEPRRESRGVIDDVTIEPLEVLVAETEYVAPNQETLHVTMGKFESDSAAYCHFTRLRKQWRDRVASLGQVENVGTASAPLPDRGLTFFKGTNSVTVISENGKDLTQATAFARVLAATLDNGEGEVPVLVKHLPNWETAQTVDVYAVSTNMLRDSIPDQAILKEVSFEGGTEAVTANYGQSQVIIVEFTTPQFASDNDRRIVAKIQELKNQGQPVPTAYRRVGNYSVFVFNAPDEKTANGLIDQVNYEQVVQWLGDDPHLYERIQRYFMQKTGGVVIAVLESSGLSLILCLGVGGLFGALLFRRRRARQRGAESYSDAGGMVRLNLDEVTEANDASRLLQDSNKPV